MSDASSCEGACLRCDVSRLQPGGAWGARVLGAARAGCWRGRPHASGSSPSFTGSGFVSGNISVSWTAMTQDHKGEMVILGTHYWQFSWCGC